MSSLADKYRPTTLDGFLGNPKAVAAVRWHLDRGLGGKWFWISGATGTGKTTLARIMAAAIAHPLGIDEFDSADQLNQAEFDRLSLTLRLSAPPPGGRVVIVNEAHGLAPRIMRQMLGLAERFPQHATLIFTTTRAGEQKLMFDDIDGGPLLGRCVKIPLSVQGLSDPAARRIVEIAALEGFTVPVSKIKDLLSDNGLSIRDAINWLGTPQSMPYLNPPDAPSALAA